MQVDGASILLICHHCLWLVYLNYGHVRWHPAGLVQLMEALAEDALPLSNSACYCHEKLPISSDPTDGDKFGLAGLIVNQNKDQLRSLSQEGCIPREFNRKLPAALLYVSNKS